MKFTPYWLDTSPRGPTGRGTEVGGDVDVAIVGAGLTGLSAALHLARKGAKVAVFERETVGLGSFGAQRRDGDHRPVDRLPRRDRPLRVPDREHAPPDLLRRDRRHREARRRGGDRLRLRAHRQDEPRLEARSLDGLRKTHDVLAERLGYETQLVPKSELHSEIGCDAYHGAMIDPKGAGLHVGKFTRGLAEAAARQGVQIHEKAPVEQVRRLGGTRHEVVTPRGSVRADQVLVATSGYTSTPLPVAADADRACRQLHHRHRAARQGGLRPAAAQAPDGLGHQEPSLLLPDHPDHRLLFGGRARFAMSDPQSDEKSGRILRKAMISVFPQLAQARVDYCWGGPVDMSMDRMVHAGEHDGLFYSLGYSGHGVQMATYMGKQMAEYMNGVPDANPWRDLTFKRIPGHVGPPWFLPFAGAYYKFQDIIK